MIKYTKLLCLLLLVVPAMRDNREIRCYVVTAQFPIYDKNGTILGDQMLDGTHRIFLYHDLTMYELPYGFATGIDGNAASTVYETRYRYFVFHKDSLQGIEYELRYPGQEKHRDVSSARRSFSSVVDTGQAANMYFHRGFPLLSSKRDAANGSLSEVYKVEDPKHPGDRDSVSLWYSDRYAMLPADMFIVHDSMPRMRLTRIHIQMHLHDLPATPGQPMPDHADFFWKVEETAFFNRDSAAIFFNKYQAYCDSSRRAGQTTR